MYVIRSDTIAVSYLHSPLSSHIRIYTKTLSPRNGEYMYRQNLNAVMVHKWYVHSGHIHRPLAPFCTLASDDQL